MLAIASWVGDELDERKQQRRLFNVEEAGNGIEVTQCRCAASLTVHRESKKQDTKLLAINSLTIIRFSNFFH